jgi:hypothetical protein
MSNIPITQGQVCRLTAPQQLIVVRRNYDSGKNRDRLSVYDVYVLDFFLDILPHSRPVVCSGFLNVYHFLNSDSLF